jgi:hypothetical protein
MILYFIKVLWTRNFYICILDFRGPVIWYTLQVNQVTMPDNIDFLALKHFSAELED